MTHDLANPPDAVAGYMTGQIHPSQGLLLEQFSAESADSIAALGPALDIPYGQHPREVFDLYTSKTRWRGTVAYLHAGYWQSRDKAPFRFLANGFGAQGFDVVMVNYPLCPDVTLRALVEGVRQGVPAILSHLGGLGRGGSTLIACGHSAGGHLAVELALTDWAGPSPIAAIVAVSGVYDLTPLVRTPLNDKLRLDLTEARAMSPLHRVHGHLPPARFIVGGRETVEFQAQTAAMHQAWLSGHGKSTMLTVADADHFSVLRTLAKEQMA